MTNAPAGAPLAAHFETKRRVVAIVKQRTKQGEQVEEATREDVCEAACKADETTVFKFAFHLADAAASSSATRATTRCQQRRRRRRRRKHRLATTLDNVAHPRATGERRDGALLLATSTIEDKTVAFKADTEKTATLGTLSCWKLRKATGTDSEVAKMHLRYGQGRRNLAAMHQRAQRPKRMDACPMAVAASSSGFQFNFSP